MKNDMENAKKDDLIDQIIKLKNKYNISILAHNYQSGDIQDVADYVGDSLELATIASKISNNTICFCGVRFMAESAAIICNKKQILIPDTNAGCALADDFRHIELKQLRAQHPDAAVVCYINSSAKVKAMSDICCTSANAVKIVNSLVNFNKIIFVPDRNLGSYVSLHTMKKIILTQITCPVHNKIPKKEVIEAIKKYPEAEFIAHPECSPDILQYAHFISSTSGMAKHIAKSDCKSFIIGTEEGMIYVLSKRFPSCMFYLPSKIQCGDMKLITLPKLLKCLKERSPVIDISSELKEKARRSLLAMMEV